MTKNNKLGLQLLIMPVTTVVQNITSITLKRSYNEWGKYHNT